MSHVKGEGGKKNKRKRKTRCVTKATITWNISIERIRSGAHLIGKTRLCMCKHNHAHAHANTNEHVVYTGAWGTHTCRERGEGETERETETESIPSKSGSSSSSIGSIDVGNISKPSRLHATVDNMTRYAGCVQQRQR